MGDSFISDIRMFFTSLISNKEISKTNNLRSYHEVEFLIKNFLEILNEKPIAIKCTIAPIMMAFIRLSKRYQLIPKEVREGIVTIIAIKEPLSMISLVVTFPESFSFIQDYTKIW